MHGGGAPILLPSNTVLPAITGDAKVGATLTSSTGTWINSPTSYAYQWKSDGANVGTDQNTYVPVEGDIGNTITVTVTASNAAGGSPATSAATDPVVEALSPIVGSDFKNGVYSISGVSKTLGQVWEANADLGAWNPASVVGGVGLLVTAVAGSAFENPCLTSAAASDILPTAGGFTVAFHIVTTQPVDGSVSILVLTADFPDFNGQWSVQGQDAASQPLNCKAVVTDGTLSATITGLVSGANAISATLDPTHMAVSLNGSAASVTAAPASGAAFTNIGAQVFVNASTGTGTIVIESIDFYEPVADADLPALSA